MSTAGKTWKCKPSDRTVGIRAGIMAMHAAGKNQCEIAEQMGIAPSSVSYHGRAIGLVFAMGNHARRDVKARRAALMVAK